jgi:hypothetical protein
MAGNAFKYSDITVVGIDLSTQAVSCELTVNTDEAEAGTMVSQWKDFHAGASDATITVTYVQNYATGSVDPTHWDLVSAASSFVVQILPSGSTAAGNNPIYSGSCILTSYQPVNVEYANVAQVQATYRVRGALGRAES